MLEHMLSGISERLERLWNVMFDGQGDRGVWEEKAATTELLMNYLRDNVDVLKKLGDGGGGKVDDGILGILFNRGYSDEAIAAFFGVSRHTIIKRRRLLKLKRVRWKPVEAAAGLPPYVLESVDAYNRLKSVKLAAKELGKSDKTVCKHLYFARHPEKYFERRRRPSKPSLYFVVSNGCRNTEGRWLVNVFRKHAIHRRRIFFDSGEERIRFLLTLFDGEDVNRVRKRVLTRWLKEINMLEDSEVKIFYEKLSSTENPVPDAHVQCCES